jgi:hypothetical protein
LPTDVLFQLLRDLEPISVVPCTLKLRFTKGREDFSLLCEKTVKTFMWQPLHHIERALLKIHSSITVIWDGMIAVKSEEGLPQEQVAFLQCMSVCR